MTRPYRPHPEQKPTTGANSEAHKRWKAAHPKQETRAEAKARKRAEAERRNTETLPENRKAARKNAAKLAA